MPREVPEHLRLAVDAAPVGNAVWPADVVHEGLDSGAEPRAAADGGARVVEEELGDIRRADGSTEEREPAPDVEARRSPLRRCLGRVAGNDAARSVGDEDRE